MLLTSECKKSSKTLNREERQKNFDKYVGKIYNWLAFMILFRWNEIQKQIWFFFVYDFPFLILRNTGSNKIFFSYFLQCEKTSIVTIEKDPRGPDLGVDVWRSYRGWTDLLNTTGFLLTQRRNPLLVVSLSFLNVYLSPFVIRRLYYFKN